jgi:glycosyltransferase involved in cell wall biosynthesis
MKQKTILATCYAINPYKGSEDGMGWNFVYQIARYNKVIAITRENNRPWIEKYLNETSDEVHQNITIKYFDLPYWMRFWKKGSRGALLYYYMWQYGIVPFIKKQQFTFDIVHNVNFHNDWTPSFLWKLKKPMVWGPVGHHPLIPKQYLQPYSKKYYWIDRGTWIVKNIFWKFSLSLQKTAQKSNHIWCMNTSVPSVLNINPEAFSIFPSVATNDYSNGKTSEKENFGVISVGRFVPLKGFDLTLLSFIEFLKTLTNSEKTKCKLLLVGTGPEKKMYEKIIKEYKVEDYVEIIEWIERSKLMAKYEKSSVFLFPSHEGAGMVVPEAMSFGLPIVCLKNEGPGEFIHDDCGFAIPHSDYKKTVSELSNALQKLFHDKELLNKMSIKSRELYLNKFTWDSRGEKLYTIYNQL